MEPRNRFQETDSWAPRFTNSGSAWRLIEELVTQQNFIKLAFSSSFLALKLTHLFRGQILGQNSDKVLRVSSMLFSHLYSFALRFLFLKTHATSYSFNISVTTIPYPLTFGLWNPQKPQVRELSRICLNEILRNLNEILSSWIRLLV